MPKYIYNNNNNNSSSSSRTHTDATASTISGMMIHEIHHAATGTPKQMR